MKATVQRAIGLNNNQLTIVKERKLHWYGYIYRSSGPAKTILQGTVKGSRKRERQKKRWEDNIREWTGLDFATSQRAVEDRTKWREIVRTAAIEELSARNAIVAF